MSKLIIYGRHACHLCEVMVEELMPLLRGSDITLVIEDVDSCDDWIERYGKRVPVLETGEGEELCQYHLNEDVVQAWIALQHGEPVS